MTVNKKEFCLWLVPTDSGQVKKLRVSARRALAIGAIAFFIASFFVLIAGDYARVQMLRAKSYFNIQQLTHERDELDKTRISLEGTIESLESKNAKVSEYERNIRTRVQELDTLLETAASMGMIPPQRPEKRGQLADSSETSAMGGAEIECSNCLQGKSGAARVVHPDRNTRNLLERLDEYLELVSSLPLGSPANGHLSSGYGMRRSPFSGKWRKHQGIDFSVPSGSAILSTGDGVVKAVKRTPTYGRMIDIDHGNGVVTRYAHLSSQQVKVGERVCRGQAIGLAGSTGRSTGPHLHYEIRVRGRALDPTRLLHLARDLHSDF